MYALHPLMNIKLPFMFTYEWADNYSPEKIPLRYFFDRHFLLMFFSCLLKFLDVKHEVNEGRKSESHILKRVSSENQLSVSISLARFQFLQIEMNLIAQFKCLQCHESYFEWTITHRG
jgi:hypothetical protein